MSTKAKQSKLSSEPNADVYDRVTATIIDALETASTTPTEWPWNRSAGGQPINATTKKSYHGINWLLLNIAQQGGASRYWATFKQWQALNATVKKGSKGTLVTFWGDLFVDANGDRCDPTDAGAKKILYAKPSYVFSSDQVEGWQEPEQNGAPLIDTVELLDEAEAFFRNTGAVYKEGNAAFYQPSTDEITLPRRALFNNTSAATATQNFYRTKGHETIHWTGAKARCDRDFSGRFGSNSYAFEELVAELGTAFLCAELGIAGEPTKHNVEYLANWLEVLKGDKKAIFTAASKAQQALRYLQALQPPESDAEAEELVKAA